MWFRFFTAALFKISGVFIIMTIQTQQLPVTSVLGIMIMIVISMVYGQFPQIFPGEFSLAAATDPWIHLERLFTIGMTACFTLPAGFCHYGFQLV